MYCGAVVECRYGCTGPLAGYGQRPANTFQDQAARGPEVHPGRPLPQMQDGLDAHSCRHTRNCCSHSTIALFVFVKECLSSGEYGLVGKCMSAADMWQTEARFR
jgi:hypothetical protein